MQLITKLAGSLFGRPELRRLSRRFNIVAKRDPGNRGDAVRRAYECRPDLRAAFPLAYTPVQREAFAVWCFENGRPDLGFNDQDILGFLHVCERDSSHGLFQTWLLTPEWQRDWPEALTPAGWPDFCRGVAKRHSITSSWVRRARCPFVPPLERFGVNILAHFRYPSGLQEEAFQYAEAIWDHGGGVCLRDAPVGYPRGLHQMLDDYLEAERYPVTIAKLGVCESFDDQYALTGWHPRQGVTRIAAWSWELASLPRRIAGTCTLADEIWTPSAFCAAAVQGAFPEKTVTAMLPAVSVPKFEAKPRSHFGLPADCFLFFFAFDMGSVMERKNPLGLIAAFNIAFQGDDRVHLAIKVTRGDSRPGDFAILKAAATGNVTIIDAVLPRGEVTALMNCCDCYISLHRAEGFGYTMAEAMLLGKPVIATGYSANVEFMDDSNALLVKHTMVQVGRGHEPYPADAVWAEPDLDHAAALMRRVYQHTADAQKLGTRARDAASQLLSPQAAGVRMLRRLHQIQSKR